MRQLASLGVIDYLPTMSNAAQMTIEPTEDGSPTVCTTYPSGITERMHHRGGAFSETIYIYGPAIDAALETVSQSIGILSVGLGLGYNEILSLGLALKLGVSLKSLVIDSYEANKSLIANFGNWAGDDLSDKVWNEAYDDIARRVADLCECEVRELKSTVRTALASGALNLHGPLSLKNHPRRVYQAILYDAFSTKMDPELWQEEDLTRFIGEASMSGSVLATYAATGALNRALRKNHFALENKSGFAGKRQSTFARRLG